MINQLIDKQIYERINEKLYFARFIYLNSDFEIKIFNVDVCLISECCVVYINVRLLKF